MDAQQSRDTGDTLAEPCPFDEQVLHRLAEQLSDERPAVAFATGYLEQLDHRVTRLRSALDQGDQEQSMDAALSLKVSSATVGARELESLAVAVEGLLRTGRTAAALRVGAALPAAAARTRLDLRHYLDTNAGG